MADKKFLIIFFSILSVVTYVDLTVVAYEGQEKDMSSNIESDQLDMDINEDIDPHFTGQYCHLCHERTPEKGGETYLKFGGDFIQMCNCHKYTAGTYIHPVFLKPTKEKKDKMPEEFPLDNGKITCRTCHDFYQQCQKNQSLLVVARIEKKHNRLERMFLRGSPYRKRTDICFKCHDETKYKMLDPHNQLSSNGEIVTEKCLYCHKEKPDVQVAAFSDVELIGNLKVLCQRCHGALDKHPANVNHYLRPSDKMFTRMKIIEGEYGVVLPLDVEGKLTCITCHNPHERGVIPTDHVGAMGASEKYRHRLPGILCKSCHRL